MDDNSLHHMSNSSSSDPYPDFTQLASVRLAYVCLYLAVMGLSAVGNAAVCFTVFTNRHMQTAVNYYLVNLAACDLMVGCFVLPLKLLELTSPAHWAILNDPLCTLLMYLQTIVVFASVLTLVAICRERYMAVLHPLESRMHQTKARAKRILLAVWLAPFLVASPFLYPAEAFANDLRSPYGSISRLTCFVRLPEDVRRMYYTFLFIAIYCLPLLFIGGTCVQVARCLLKDIPVHRQGSVRRQEANRRKVAQMVLMVVFSFGVCWTPYFLVSIITQYQEVNFMEKGNFFFTMLNINLLAFLNSCVNPFIYASMSSRFRNGFLRCIDRMLCCSCCFSSSNGHELEETVRMYKKVRFRCQPICLIIQSSSDGSNEMNQKTLSAVEQREKGSMFRRLFGDSADHSMTAHCIKKGKTDTPQSNNEDVNYTLENRLNALAEKISIYRNELDARRTFSTGDMFSVSEPKRQLRKYSSSLSLTMSTLQG